MHGSKCSSWVGAQLCSAPLPELCIQQRKGGGFEIPPVLIQKERGFLLGYVLPEALNTFRWWMLLSLRYVRGYHWVGGS